MKTHAGRAKAREQTAFEVGKAWWRTNSRDPRGRLLRDPDETYNRARQLKVSAVLPAANAYQTYGRQADKAFMPHPPSQG